jgi:hypothetical protein
VEITFVENEKIPDLEDFDKVMITAAKGAFYAAHLFSNSEY